MNTKKTVLLTGITGFIGRNVAEALQDNYNITALIRPNTDINRYNNFNDKVNIVEIDLSDTKSLISFLIDKKFDYILHIGALRGGRKYNNDEFFKANVSSTEALINNAIKNTSKFIFCSSVGVYGAIPTEVPANLNTPYKEDNYYHFTKIQCEKMIQEKIYKNELQGYIIRPSITYGIGDYGFPYTLIKLIHKKMLFLPKEPIYIHLTNVHTLVEVFTQLLQIVILRNEESKDFEPGKIWNVADKNKICFQDLAEYISQEIHKKSYSKIHLLPRSVFKIFTKSAKLFKNELWTSRFELISNDWFYDVEPVYNDFELSEYNTIPSFKTVIDWYLSKN